MSDALGLYNYWIAIFLMMVGFYNVIASGNLVKKLIGLSIFQTSVFLLYITIWTLKAFICPKAKIIILSLPKSCFLLFPRFSILLSP